MWPVDQFINEELAALLPLSRVSLHFSSFGFFNLLLALFFAHGGRILADRPDMSQKEIFLVGLALVPAIIFAFHGNEVIRRMFHGFLHEGHPPLPEKAGSATASPWWGRYWESAMNRPSSNSAKKRMSTRMILRVP